MKDVVKADRLFDLTGEVALVTGASSGLGERFARVLAAHGAKVMLAARRLDRLQALKNELGGGAAATELDVLSRESMARAFDAAEQAFGPVTLLVNNAGTANGEPFLETTPAEWERVRQTNVDGVWLMAQEAAKRMVAAKCEGAIVNLASILSYRVLSGNAAYCVSKAAVAQMTEAMAVELARHKIRVNAIAPGFIWSEMTEAFLKSPRGEAITKAIPQRRIGNPSDLDGALLLLASKRASGYMTGTTIVADGGHMWSFT